MIKNVFLFIIMLLCIINLSYAKLYEVEDNATITTTISLYEPTRIKIDSDRIIRTVFNSDDLKLDADTRNGDIYLKPANLSKKIFNLFLTTERGFTYQLILNAKNINSDQIILKKVDSTLKRYADSSEIRREVTNKDLINDSLYFNFNEDFKLAAINLLKHMARMNSLKNFTVVEREEEILDYGKNVRAKWLFSYIMNDSSQISGEIIQITNKSNKVIDLSEEQFFRRGIRAVRVEKMKLQPNESCFLYLIGGGNNNG